MLDETYVTYRGDEYDEEILVDEFVFMSPVYSALHRRGFRCTEVVYDDDPGLEKEQWMECMQFPGDHRGKLYPPATKRINDPMGVEKDMASRKYEAWYKFHCMMKGDWKLCALFLEVLTGGRKDADEGLG